MHEDRIYQSALRGRPDLSDSSDEDLVDTSTCTHSNYEDAILGFMVGEESDDDDSLRDSRRAAIHRIASDDLLSSGEMIAEV